MEKKVKLEDFELEDLANWQRYKSALDILLDYYFLPDEAAEIRNRN